MRIAIDARELQGKPTGVGRFLAELLRVWTTLPEAEGHEFVQMMPDPKGSATGTLWEQTILPSMARDIAADVLFAPAYSGPLRPPVPMVVAIHDVSFAAHPEWFGWREGASRRTIVRLAARAASRVLTISEFSKREITAHLGVEPEKVAVVYPGISELNHPLQIEARDPATVLFVGSIFNRRHVPVLIEAFGRLAHTRSDIRLEIVGDNRTSPHIDLDASVRASPVPDRIHLRAYVPDEELRSLYSRASAFVFLSEYEGFGLTPLEALAAGIPVLLLDTPVAREVCGDAATYVSTPDPELVEQALRRLLFDREERARLLGEANAILSRYSWDASARQVLELLLHAAHA